MAAYRYVVADVFTDRALEGNQLAVFTDARGLDDETMQRLAFEIGFSETTFVLPPEQGGTVRIRIFTPKTELPFAGHPCLGTAWVLAAPLQRGVVELETASGIVPVELDRDDSGAVVFGRMEQFVSPELDPVLQERLRPKVAELPALSPCTLLIRTASYRRVGEQNPQWTVGEFLDWLLKAREVGITTRMLEHLVLRRRIHKDNMGLRESDSRKDYARILMASLKRKRDAS